MVIVFKEKLKDLLDQNVKCEVDAAVLIPIKDGRDPKIIMIKRGKNLTRSSGHVAFPGGMIEKNETPKDAALREVKEELGIDGVEILGYLNPTIVMTYEIWLYPVVGLIKNLEFKPDEFEVSKVLIDNLEKVLKSRTVTDWGATFYCDGELVWGASSRVLDDLYIRIIKRYENLERFFKDY
ncbi:MAG: CoA pyrophosphatase [Archaeoglobaceae archaeon]|nr:CoA pyrophosphatase [Archaeoglobaceae archaeon]MCX8152450.1 CoA pyrophosphatase [Archaeoglobaceae archaeon]MDW8013790.1 CoA pyrophosphatase [Archaeoglobaceae archaeon]